MGKLAQPGAKTAEDRFATNTFRRCILPAMASLAGVMLSTLANTLVAGNLLGEGALAVLALMNPIYFTFATLGSLAGVGASARASWFAGQNDQQGCDAVFTLSAILTLGGSLLIALIGLCFTGPLLRLLGANNELMDAARSYLSIYLFSGIGIAGIYPPYFLLKLEGRSRSSMALFLGLAVLCAGLELLFAAGLGMGLNGVALGCTIGNVAIALAGWVLLVKGSFRFRRPGACLSYLPKMLAAGSPSALNNLCTTLQGTTLNRLVAATAATAGLSALNLVSTASTLSLILINAMGQTTGPFVGVFVSEWDNASLMQVEKQAVKLGLLTVLPASIALFLLRNPFCRLFGVTDPTVLALAGNAVGLFAVSLLPAMLSTLLLNYYQGSRHAGLACLLAMCRTYAALAPAAFLLSKPLGLSGIWLAFTAGELLAWLVTGIALLLTRRRKPELEGILLLDRRAETAGKAIAFSVFSAVDEITAAAARITDFCEQNELNAKRTMLVSLSLEEMMVSIKDHVFPSDEEQTISIRILLTPEPGTDQQRILMRIRCAGTPFNPLDYYEQRKKEAESGDSELDRLEGLEDSLGIAMILAAAKRVDYRTTFGVNNLTVTL